MAEKMIKGFPSTSGDDFQLNTITMLRHAAEFFPDTEIVDRNLDGSLFRYNYRAAYTRVKRLANALETLGVRPGDRVGVMEWNSRFFYELYFAVSGMGAVLVQVNPRISPKERAYVINHSGASVLFVTELMCPLVEPIAHELEHVNSYCIISEKPTDQVATTLSPRQGYEEILAAAPEAREWAMIDETAAFSACYTSGTTGKPKGVYYSHRAIYLHTMVASAGLQVGLGDVILQMVPMFHCHGWGFFFIATMMGCKLVFPGVYTAETTNVLVDLMISQKVTVTGGAPAIFLPMLEYIKTLDETPDFTGLRMFSGATEPSRELMKGFWELGRADIIHAYGATEAAPVVTANLLKPKLARLDEEAQWEHKKKQGLPMPGLAFKVVDEEGCPVPRDGKTIGEVLVKGPWITQSYYNDPRNDAAFSDGFWRSGDGGCLDENGYLKISDRFKDLIKSGGEWISSIDLENELMCHDDVLEAAVVGIEHPKWEERPLALVVLHKWVKDAPGQVRDALYSHLSGKFARWQFPDELLFVDEIPKTSVGKFYKKVIRKQYRRFYTDRPMD